MDILKDNQIFKNSLIFQSQPKSNEVVLKVEAAGLCLSDPHILHVGPVESKPPLETPSKFVMGHEIAGSISAVGDQLANDPYYKRC